VESVCKVLVFAIDGLQFALRVGAVERVVRAVYITPLPAAPASVIGVIDVHGRIMPVADIRKRLGLPQRDIRLTDHFIIARTFYRPVALVVDEVAGILEVSDQVVVPSREILRDFDGVEGAIRLSSEIILIYDLSQFLSIEEESALQNALEQQTQRNA
jgi:purine-binding chemotaxis protein CheW